MFTEKASQVIIKLLGKMNWEIHCVLLFQLSHKSVYVMNQYHTETFKNTLAQHVLPMVLYKCHHGIFSVVQSYNQIKEKLKIV